MTGLSSRAYSEAGWRLWSAIGNQLRCPTGKAGVAAGKLMAAINRRPIRLTLAALDPQPGEDILEIGFGSGQGLALLGKLTGKGHICGIDHSAEMVRQAMRRNGAAVASGKMGIVQGRFNRLGWPDGSFDAILLANVIYFFDTGGSDIREVHRVLRHRGRVAIYVTDRSSMERWPFCRPDTHRVFDTADVEALLMQGGFDRDAIRLSTRKLPFGINGIIAVAKKV